jgi:hypothetical protein
MFWSEPKFREPSASHSTCWTHPDLSRDLHLPGDLSRNILQATLGLDRICRTINELDLVQLNVLIFPAAAAAYGRLVQGPQTVPHALERGILLAISALPDCRAGLPAWPAPPASQEHPKLREAHAQDPCRYLGQPGEASAMRQIFCIAKMNVSFGHYGRKYGKTKKSGPEDEL